MPTTNSRGYNFKDEELPILSRFVAFSFKRDISDFTAYSPKFNNTYATGFDAKIASAFEVIQPENEMNDQKAITRRLYASMDGLLDLINRLSGYITLAQPGINISENDFGFTQLRKSINAKDAEGVINSLYIVSGNITKYRTILGEQGLADELCEQFVSSATAIANDKQLQYEISSNRKSIAHGNLALFNGLFQNFNEICTVGKILYKKTDAFKLKEYTLNELKKRVHKTQKPNDNIINSNNAVTSEEIKK